MRNDKDAEIASLRAELAAARGCAYGSSSEANRLGAAARQDAETIARLRERLTVIADWDRAPISGERRESLLGIIRSICDCARAALAPRPGAANETDPKSRIAKQPENEKGGK